MAKLIEKLGDEPISLIDAKLQCYIDPVEQDVEIDQVLERLIPQVRQIAEGRTWLGLIYGKYEMSLNGFPKNEIKIPKPPLHSIEQITYLTSDGVQDLSSDLFYVDELSEPGLIGPVTDWPRALDRSGSVKIKFIGGYKHVLDEEDPEHLLIPEDIKGAMLALLGFFFDNRAGTVPDRVTPIAIPKSALDVLDDASIKRFT